MASIDSYSTATPADADSVLGIDASASATARFLLSSLATYFGGIKFTVEETAHGFSVGDLVRKTSGDWATADASTLANAMHAGMVVSVPDADTFILQVVGSVSGLSGLTDGSWYYLQDDGSLDTSADSIWCPVLVATSSTTGVLMPAQPMPNLGDLADVSTAGAGTSSALVYSSGWITIKNNVTAGAPGVGDDDGDGYSIGSRWYDVTGDNEYVCLDNSTGAAVWKQTT